MLILLSDGAGLTARQCATVLARAGYQVEALCPAGLCLARVTRHVRRVHPVPAIGRDPFGWLDAALGIAARRQAGLLLPVQEQVAVMSLARQRIEAAGLATAVPEFGALAQVQDKVSAFGTLTRLGLPQPAAVVAATAAELAGAELGLPVFVKTPIGTASAGVWRVTSREALRQLAADCERQGVFEGAARHGGVATAGSWTAGSWTAGSWTAGSWTAGSWRAGASWCSRLWPGRWSWSSRCSPAASWSPATPASGSARAPRAEPATRSAWTCRRRASTWPGWARPWAGTAHCRPT